MNFTGQTIGVLGLARSGVAAAKVLHARGARVLVYDGKGEAQLDAGHVASVRALGIEPQFGITAIDYDGLDVLVTSPGVPKSSPLLQGALAAGVPVWSEIEAAYRVASAPILAVTGTNGKTTTTVLLGEMLRAAGIETYVAGNIAAGDIAMPLIEAAHVAPKTAAIAAEVSSFQLEWVSSFRPKVAALLNISPDHGDRQMWDEYVEAKFCIFAYQRCESDWVINRATDDFAVIHYDIWGDEVEGLHKFHEHYFIDTQCIPGQTYTYGGIKQTGCGVWQRGDEIVVDDNSLGSGFDNWTRDRNAFPVLCKVADIKLPGAHNVENVMAAAAMATAFGVPVDAIRKVATTFTGVVHRLEYVRTLDGVRYVNNSMCTNEAAFRRSLEALPEPKVVVAGGIWKGGDLSPLAQDVVNGNVRALVLIGQSAPDIAAAVQELGYENVTLCDTLQGAVDTARALAQPGDTVLLAPACTSFGMFRDFEDRGEQFKMAVNGLEAPPHSGGAG